MMSSTQAEINRINAILPPNIQLGAHSSPEELWAAVFSLFNNHVVGPEPFATWKDAAVHEKLTRLRAEKQGIIS